MNVLLEGRRTSKNGRHHFSLIISISRFHFVSIWLSLSPHRSSPVFTRTKAKGKK